MCFENIMGMMEMNDECLDFVRKLCEKYDDPHAFFVCMCMMFDYVCAKYKLDATKTIAEVASIIMDVNSQLGAMEIAE